MIKRFKGKLACLLSLTLFFSGQLSYASYADEFFEIRESTYEGESLYHEEIGDIPKEAQKDLVILQEESAQEVKTELEENRNEENIPEEALEAKGQEGKEESQEIPQEEEEFNQSMLKEGILIQVRANAGVFPKEAKLHVETVEDLSSTQKIEEAIEAELSEEESLEQKIAFDITIRDAQGKELQPDISKGEVIVSFDQVREIPDQELVSEERLPEEENKIQVFHMEDLQSEVRLLETIAAEPQEVKLDVKAEHFSLFIISFIGKNKGNGTTATRGFAVGTPKKLKRILRSVLGNEWYTKTIASVIPADLDILEIKSDGSGNYEVTLKKKMNTSFRVNFTDGSFSQIKVLAQDAMYSGRIGDGVTYELSGPDDDLTLTIKGSGKIEKISYYPWEYYAGTIKTVVIGEGVKKVPKELFYSYSKLTKVIFSEGLEEIGDNAFGCCNELGDITLPASLKIVGNQAFDKDEAKSDGTKNTITNLSAVKLHDQTELPDNGYYHYNTMYTNGVNMPKTLDPLYAPGSIQIRNIELSKFYQDKGALRFQVVHSDKNWYKDTVHKYYLITNSSPTPSALADFKNTDGSFRDEYELIATGIREEYGEIYDSAGNVEFLDVISSGQIGYGFAASWRLGFTKYGHLLCVAEQRDHPGNVLISNVETFTILPEALSTPMEGTWGGIHWRLEPKIEGGVAVQNASTLTLTGSGDMPNLSESTPAPWEVALKSYDLGEGYYVNIGEGITSIGSHVFKYANLQGNLPSSLNRIEKNAFEFSNFPRELKIPEKIKVIPENAFHFSNSGAEPCRLVLNPGLEVILEGGFRKCNFYGDIVLPQGLKTIGASAFQDVNAAESIYIPRSVTVIGNLAFYKSEMGYVGKNNISNRSAVKITDLIMNPIYTTVSSGGSGGGSGGGGGGSHSGGSSLGPSSAKGSWQRDAKGWWFKHENGSWPASKWEKIQSSWYYFGSEGYMASGWLNEGGKWYYLGGADDGKMKTGWLALGGKWYFFEASGAMKTGWLESGGKWYYLNEAAGAQNGMMLSNTQVKGWKLGADGAWIP